MPAIGFGIADLVGAGAADAGALGVLDAGLVEGAVPGAIADVGALGATDALGAGATADIGLGAAGLGDVASTAGLGDAAALGVGLDATGVSLGADALGAIGGDLLGPGTLGTFGSAPGAAAADVASLTPGATSLGGGLTGALGGATGAPISAIGALEAAANPEDLLAISSPGSSITGIPGATDVAALGQSDVPLLGGAGGGGSSVATLDPSATPGALTSQMVGLNTTPMQTSGFVPPATGSPVVGGGSAGAGAAASGGGGASLGAGTAGALGDIGSSMDQALTAMGPEQLAGATSPGAGGLFGTGISGKDAALYGLAGAPLAMALFKGEPGIPPQTQQSTALSGPEQAFAQQMLASGGAPNAFQSAQIAQNSQNRLNQYRQMLFNQGVQNPQADSRWPAIVQLDQQEQAKEVVAFQQQNMQEAFAAAGGASSALAAAGQIQAQQDAAYTQALQNAMRSAGTTLALGGAFGTKVQPTVSI